ncbi:hypothetical protein B0I37DRAFT_98589 [Chaetomium sp. MPI-CAGE-AT-0009]|nr:hypothetical protein B0I37DRAFT_98589 [Chaetomium sp. MPI-CAGE-AT-0009]
MTGPEAMQPYRVTESCPALMTPKTIGIFLEISTWTRRGGPLLCHGGRKSGITGRASTSPWAGRCLGWHKLAQSKLRLVNGPVMGSAQKCPGKTKEKPMYLHGKGGHFGPMTPLLFGRLCHGHAGRWRRSVGLWDFLSCCQLVLNESLSASFSDVCSLHLTFLCHPIVSGTRLHTHTHISTTTHHTLVVAVQIISSNHLGSIVLV